MRRFASWDEVCALVAHFEAGDLPHAEWNHGAHLTAAFWYLSRLDRAEATARIRSGIIHYNDCQGTANTETSGYHSDFVTPLLTQVQCIEPEEVMAC